MPRALATKGRGRVLAVAMVVGLGVGELVLPADAAMAPAVEEDAVAGFGVASLPAPDPIEPGESTYATYLPSATVAKDVALPPGGLGFGGGGW